MLGNLSYRLDDTIAAIATAAGVSARAIIRIAGPGVADCLSEIFEPECASGPDATADLLIQTQAASVFPGHLLFDASAPQLPCQVYYWPDERSFTKSPLAEIHLPGSQALAEAALDLVCGHGVRLAAGGEFTLRAFLAGRIDLTEAEAVLGLIDAGSEGEFDVALHQLAGGLSGPITQLRDRLLHTLAELEAGLDFAEEDIECISNRQLLAILSKTQDEISKLQAQMKSRTVASETIRVVFCGSANVGKSSLFNCMVDGAALESDLPGTTRDYLAATLDLDRIRCELVDTAGVAREDGSEPIMIAAQASTARQLKQADIHLFCLDASRPLNDWEQDQLACQPVLDRVIVLTKCDMMAELPHHARLAQRPEVICTSSHSGVGVEALCKEIRDRALAVPAEVGGTVACTAVRCRESLQQASEAVSRSSVAAERGLGHELVATEIRVALDGLGQVVGAVYTDDMLERIFSRFCIGK